MILVLEMRTFEDLKEQQLNKPAGLLDFIDDKDTGLSCCVALSDCFCKKTGLRAFPGFCETIEIFMRITIISGIGAHIETLHVGVQDSCCRLSKVGFAGSRRACKKADDRWLSATGSWGDEIPFICVNKSVNRSVLTINGFF